MSDKDSAERAYRTKQELEKIAKAAEDAYVQGVCATFTEKQKVLDEVIANNSALLMERLNAHKDWSTEVTLLFRGMETGMSQIFSEMQGMTKALYELLKEIKK